MRAVTTIKIKQCCHICKHCDVDDNDEDLICLLKSECVDEDAWCEQFVFTVDVLKDSQIYNLLIPKPL